jgi:hypothetical protein
LAELLGELGERFEHVVIDSPPVLSVTDATIVSRIVDGVVLVVQSGATSRGALLRTVRTLDTAGARILMIIAVPACLLAAKTVRIALAETWGNSYDPKKVQQAITLDPTNPEFRYWLAILYLSGGAGEPSEAVSSLQKAIQLNPNHAKYWLSLANACFITGDQACAARGFEQAVKLAPMKPGIEIGVYRGQVISLWALLARHLNYTIEIHAVSPFTPAADSCSTYSDEVDYLADTIRNFEYFGLALPTFHVGLSTDSPISRFIGDTSWDIAYIDGSHELEVANADFLACSQSMKPGGIIVFDDASLFTDYRPPRWSFGGHPGPSRVADRVDPTCFREILGVGHNRAFLRL